MAYSFSEGVCEELWTFNDDDLGFYAFIEGGYFCIFSRDKSIHVLTIQVNGDDSGSARSRFLLLGVSMEFTRYIQ